MPTHDWTRVTAGTFHDFHLAWLAELRTALNDGLLPPDYYAQAEQVAGPIGPDVPTLQVPEPAENGSADEPAGTGVDVATAPPQVRWRRAPDMGDYVSRQRHLVVRHASRERIVALIEVVSSGNKAAGHQFRTFVEKALEALYRGYHLLVIDLFPPGPRDPNGIHGAIWGEITDDPFTLRPDEPLTLATYSAGPTKRCYVEATAVGRALVDMPLFLDPEVYVNVPLEATYQGAYRGVPRRWREVLEAATPPDRLPGPTLARY
jgi:hypothetical protein